MDAKLVVAFVLGLFAGAGVTYLYMDKKIDEAVDNTVRTINEEKKIEKEESKKDEPLEEPKKRFDEMMEIKKEHERQMRENSSLMVDYNKISQNLKETDVKVSEEALEENADKNERIADAESRAADGLLAPFTTDVDTFSEAYTNHTKDTATYYIRDDTLIDSAGDIADTDYLVGRANIDNFINGPYDEATNDTLYIINPTSGTDLEIQVIDDVSYDPASADA